MAWNGSNSSISQSSNQSSNRNPKSSARSEIAPYRRGLFAGLIVVALGGAAVWYFVGGRGAMRPADDGGEGTRQSAEISVVRPSVATNAVKEVAEVAKPKKYKEMSNDEKLKYWRDRYGNNIPENIKPVIYFLENPPQRTFTPSKTKASVFKNRSERIIASALMIEPGAAMLQKPVYDEHFDIDFANHAVDKIEIADDDPDDIKELKQLVIDTKKDLVARVKDGEKPSDILNAHMDAMYELGKYKQQVTEMLNQYRNDETHTDQDVRDFVTAANKMLREKGATEISMPNLVARQAKLRALARKKGKTND